MTYIWILLLPVHTALLLLHVQISLCVLLHLLLALHRRHEGNPLGRTLFSCASVVWEEEGVKREKKRLINLSRIANSPSNISSRVVPGVAFELEDAGGGGESLGGGEEGRGGGEV